MPHESSPAVRAARAGAGTAARSSGATREQPVTLQVPDDAIVVVGGGPPRSRGRSTTLARADVARFGRQVRAWYRANARDLPWRRTRDPYRVLVSELMLQQTQVSRVVPRYHAFLERFPTLDAVARATPARVCEAWEGLGYYARARNLHRLARTVRDGGGALLPSDPVALRTLPGIGAYTAGAVASFAFERRAALVDTNVARVLGRVFAPRVNYKAGAGARHVWRVAEAILPRTGRATWTHNQALMELGALICTARVRRCGACPVRGVCATYRNELSTTAKSARRERAP